MTTKTLRYHCTLRNMAPQLNLSK